MDTPPPIPQPTVPAPKKGLSTGCIILIVFGFIGLVVLGLAAMAVPAFNRVKSKAHLLKTSAMLKDVKLAVKNYQAEYNHFPVLTDPGIIQTNGDLLAILLGRNVSELNPRQVAFLAPPWATKGQCGLLEIHGIASLVDTWGHPCRLRMDVDGDSEVPDPQHSGTKLKESVIVWSGGPDGNFDTWSDNITSWGL